jgi:hypothetical protein
MDQRDERQAPFRLQVLLVSERVDIGRVRAAQPI